MAGFSGFGNKRIIAFGHRPKNSKKSDAYGQRYFCKNCRRTFSENILEFQFGFRTALTTIRKTIKQYARCYSVYQVSKQTGFKRKEETIKRWLGRARVFPEVVEGWLQQEGFKQDEIKYFFVNIRRFKKVRSITERMKKNLPRHLLKFTINR